MTNNSQQRRHYLIAYRFQLRFALQVFLLLIFTSMVIGWTVYYSVWNASEGQLQRLLGEERIDQADALRFRETIRTEIGEKVLLRLFLLIFIAFVFTVFATHRMVGPIRHMEKNLKACLRGEPSKPISLRKTDEFQDLAKLINEALLENQGSGVTGQGSG
jgi:uncharacterized membrane protein SpoIIM required for sporulation